MNIDLSLLQNSLCRALCAEIRLVQKNSELIVIETPFSFSDGDNYQLYIREDSNGLVRITDNGHTLMQISYQNDVSKFRSGTRGILFDQILADLEVSENDGEIYITTTLDNIVPVIFKLSKAITQISDLTFLNRLHAENTFYEDLRESIFKIIDESLIEENYIHPDLPNAKDYPIDYYIKTEKVPLVVFGIPNKDKARLATIILERLTGHHLPFENILIFHDQTFIPKQDLARLSNVGGEMIASLEAQDDLRRKINKRLN